MLNLAPEIDQTYLHISIGEDFLGDLSFNQIQEKYPQWKEEFPFYVFFKVIGFYKIFAKCVVLNSTNLCFPKSGEEFILKKSEFNSKKIKLVSFDKKN